jgi:ribonuclease P protein subunit POP4
MATAQTAAEQNHVATQLLSLSHSAGRTSEIFKEKVKLRPLHLKPSGEPTPDARAYRRLLKLKAAEKKKKKRKPQPLSAKEKRATGLYKIPKEQKKWEVFEPLLKMWQEYMHEVLGPQRPISANVAAKLASAEYQGSMIEVTRSRCPSRVGVRGIVIRDTKYTFEVITPSNEVKILPKEHTIFQFELPEVPKEGEADPGAPPKKLVFEIHGEQFQHRSVDRANKKFKQHFLPDL